MPPYRRNLYVLCFTIFLAAISWNQIAPYLSPFLRELGVTDSLAVWAGVIFAVPSFASMIVQPLWGRLGDRVGRKPMIIRAGVCLAVIYFAMSVCQSAWQLALLRFLNGALTGFIPSSFALIATNTPDNLSGRYVATAQSASAFGAILGPVVGGILAGLVGRRASMRLCSLTVLCATLLVILLVREEKLPAPVGKSSLFGDLRRTATQEGLPLVLCLALLGAGLNPAIQSILALHLQDLEAQRPVWFDGAVYALPGLAFAALAYFWTRAGEVRSRRSVMGLGLAGAAVSLVVLSVVHSIWFFAAFYLLLGVALAAVGPNTAAHIATEIPVEVRGGTYGILQAANTGGMFIVPLLAGLVGQALGLRWVFVFLAAIAAAGALMARGGGTGNRLAHWRIPPGNDCNRR